MKQKGAIKMNTKTDVILNTKIKDKESQMNNLIAFIIENLKKFDGQLDFTADYAYQRDINKGIAMPYKVFSLFEYWEQTADMRVLNQYGGRSVASDYSVDISLLTEDEITEALKEFETSIQKEVLHAEAWLQFTNKKTYNVYTLKLK